MEIIATLEQIIDEGRARSPAYKRKCCGDVIHF